MRPALSPKKNFFTKKSQQRIAGLINGCRQKRVKQKKENEIIIRTQNVRTLLQLGKMQELAEQTSETQLEILAMQEIRWSGTGLIKKQNYSLFYSGSNGKTGQAGTGFILEKNKQNYVMRFEPYNKCLCKLRIKGKYNNITLINVYAPTEDNTEETKEQLYDNLQYLLDKTPKNDTVIILGDVNAQLGKERLYREVTGLHSLHEETSRNGELLCEFAYANNMVVMNTNFQHKRIHKITWLSRDQNTAS